MAGPAALTNPFSRRVIIPEIITAPGAAKINPTTTAKPNAKYNIASQARNSATQPYFCATNLCANSCSKKPRPAVNKEITKMNQNCREAIAAREKFPPIKYNPEYTNANANDNTTQAFDMSINSLEDVLILPIVSVLCIFISSRIHFAINILFKAFCFFCNTHQH